MSEIILCLERGDPDSGPKEVEYRVPYVEGMSLLDGIFWLREHVDSSIAVRYSCRSANACKECSASINGKPGYLCSTRARKGSKTHIKALSARQWIRDLAQNLD